LTQEAQKRRERQQADPKFQKQQAKAIARNREHLAMQDMALSMGWRPGDPVRWKGRRMFIRYMENGREVKATIQINRLSPNSGFLISKPGRARTCPALSMA
jgi:hypothetical protein